MGNSCQSSTDKLREQECETQRQPEAGIRLPLWKRIADGDAERKRIAAENAEEVTLVVIGDHDGKKIDVTVRLNNTLNALKKAAAAKCGVTNELIESLQLHFSGYQLEPETKTVRQFTELCQVS